MEESARIIARIQARSAECLNPLHQYVLVAEEFAAWFLDTQANRGEVDRCQADGWGLPLSEAGTMPLPPSPSIEQAGIADLYRWLAERGDTEYLYGNDLSRVVHGFDAVARVRSSGRVLVCEVKGTTRRVRTGFRSYLRRTKTMGRQLGWRWCWNRLLLLACHGNTAAMFLRILRPYVEDRVDRVLLASGVERRDDGYHPSRDRGIWTEEHFARDVEMKDRHNRQAQLEWFHELEAARVLPALVER